MSKKLKAYTMIAGGLAIVSALSACASTPAAQPTGSASGGGAASSLALLTPLSTDPFFQACIAAGRSAAEDLGVGEIKDYDAAQQTTAQANQLDTVIAEGVDAIVIAPADSKAILPQLEKAASEGIPIVAYNSAVTETAIDASVQMSERATSSQAATVMIDIAKERGLDTLNVVHLVGSLAVESARERAEGFDETITAAEGIEVVLRSVATEYKPEKAASALADAFTAGPVDAVFVDSDFLVTAILPVLQRAGGTTADGDNHIILGGLGGLPEGLKAIRDGWQDFTMNFPIDGQCDAAVRLASGIAAGEAFADIWEPVMKESGLDAYDPTLQETDNGPIIDLTATEVTADTASDPSLWGNAQQ